MSTTGQIIKEQRTKRTIPMLLLSSKNHSDTFSLKTRNPIDICPTSIHPVMTCTRNIPNFKMTPTPRASSDLLSSASAQTSWECPYPASCPLAWLEVVAWDQPNTAVAVMDLSLPPAIILVAENGEIVALDKSQFLRDGRLVYVQGTCCEVWSASTSRVHT